MLDDWQETRNRLRGFISRRVHDGPTADGILQETLLRALQQGSSLRTGGALTGWLYRVAANLIADHHREERRLGELPDDLPTPVEEKRALQEMGECIRPLVSRLPDRYRQAIELSELDELPHKEVASRLGLGLSGVKSRVVRGRGLLLEALRECCALEMGPTGVADCQPRRNPCEVCPSGNAP